MPSTSLIKRTCFSNSPGNLAVPQQIPRKRTYGDYSEPSYTPQIQIPNADTMASRSQQPHTCSPKFVFRGSAHEHFDNSTLGLHPKRQKTVGDFQTSEILQQKPRTGRGTAAVAEVDGDGDGDVDMSWSELPSPGTAGRDSANGSEKFAKAGDTITATT